VRVGRQLISDELGDLGVLVPCLWHPQLLSELRLIGGLELGIAEYVRAVIEGKLVAVVEHAPSLALVERDRLVERMEVVEIGWVHVFGDVIVDWQNDTAVRQSRDPGRLYVENVIGTRIGYVLGNRLGILVGMCEFDDAEIYPGQTLPERPREILGL